LPCRSIHSEEARFKTLRTTASANVQGLRLNAILPPLHDEILQAPHVHLFQLQSPDEGIELFQLQRVVLDALLVVVVLQILRRRGPKRA
jgi:hypothetical protein